MSETAIKNELLRLKNLGKVMLGILNQLNIFTVSQLKTQTPNELYLKICDLRGKIQDTKMYDMCQAIIHEANTGENKHWSEWRKQRIVKNRQKILVDYFNFDPQSFESKNINQQELTRLLPKT